MLTPESDVGVTAAPPTKVSRWLIALILILSTVVIFSSLHVLSKMGVEENTVDLSRRLRGDEQAPPPPPSPEPKKKKYFCTPDHCGDKTLYPDD